MLPPLTNLLDVRSAVRFGDNPVTEAVNIPLDELTSRMHELPPKDQRILIADSGEASSALTLLERHGRLADTTSNFTYGPSELRRLWRPNSWLEEVVPDLTASLAVDLACGSGREAVLLASSGFRTTAIDHLPDALALGESLEQRYSNGPQIEWRCSDLLQYEFESGFDLAVMFFYLDRDVLARAAQALAPAGSIVLETFTVEHRAATGKPRRPELVLDPGEIASLLPGMHIRKLRVGWHHGRHTARVWATRLPAEEGSSGFLG